MTVAFDGCNGSGERKVLFSHELLLNVFGGDDTVLNRVVVLFLVVAALTVISGLAIGVVASGANGGLFDGGGSTGVDTSGDNHQNPSELEGGGDLSAVERQLADRISAQVQSSAINLSRGEYDNIQDSLEGSQYNSLLNQYDETASQTRNENRSQLFRQVSEEQREYALAVQSYWRLYAIYNESANVSEPQTQQLISSLSFVSINETLADESNKTINESTTLELNTSQRRQLARQLDQRWRSVDENATQLLGTYRELEQYSDRNYSTAIDSLREGRQNISETQQTIQEMWLTAVSLSGSALKPQGSFTDPIQIEGQLTLANETAIADQPIELDIAGQRYQTVLNRSGWFNVSFRPTTLPLNTTNVSVRFVPSPSQPYASAMTNVTVELSQTEPEISLQVTPTVLQYNDTVSVFGRVTAGDVGVGEVPYSVTIDRQFVAQDSTRTNGTFRNTTVLPSSVSPGEQNIRVALVLDEQAVAGTDTSTSVEVIERPSDLTLSIDRVDGRSLAVSGRLTLPETGGIPEETIRIVSGETTLGTVTTDSGGRFQTNLEVSEDILKDGLGDDSTTLNIRAVYANEQSNIEQSNATATVVINQESQLPILSLLAVSVFVLLGGAFAVFSQWRNGDTADTPTAVNDDTPTAGSWSDKADTANNSLIALSHKELEADRPEVAVQLGYAALRTQFEQRLGIEPTTTPWEFYRKCRQHDTDTETIEALRQITELYEQAVFASESVPTETIEAFLEDVEDNQTVAGDVPTSD